MFRKITRERFLSDDELQRFMAVVRGRRHVNQLRDHAFFALLANTGIRPSEARALKRSDISPHARPAWIQLQRTRRRHAAHPINELVIHPAVAKVLGRYASALTVGRAEPLFPFTQRQSARLFHYYAEKAGLPRHLRIYALRHTVGIRLWRHTRDLRMIQAIMGHVRLKASACYVHIAPERMREAYARMGTVE